MVILDCFLLLLLSSLCEMIGDSWISVVSSQFKKIVYANSILELELLTSVSFSDIGHSSREPR